MNQTVQGKALPSGANQDPVGFGETGKVFFVVVRLGKKTSQIKYTQIISTT